MTSEPQLQRSLSAEVDLLCDQFESDWRSGLTPDIESYLMRCRSVNARESLFSELLALDVEYRRRKGDVVDCESLCRRFPQYGVLIAKVAEAEGCGTTGGAVVCSESLDAVARPSLSEVGDDDTKCHTGIATAMSAVPSSNGTGQYPIPLGYVVLEQIGQGGMGLVFKVRQTATDRIVALKLIRMETLPSIDPQARQSTIDRFRAEVKAAARLEHDNIVRVYDVGHVNDIPFFTMQYVDGKSLATAVSSRPCTGRQAAELLEPIARALIVAHDRGVLHRDIKPQNILVENGTNRPLLADFGLAKLVEVNEHMTAAGDLLGSPPYTAPEQLRNAAAVDERADIYSLGATLYFLLTGRPPFQANSLAEILTQIYTRDALPPVRLNPSVDRDLNTICVKCLDKEPRQRYGSMRELAAEFQHYLLGEPIAARPLSHFAKTIRWGRRNPLPAALSLLVLSSLVALVLVAAIGYAKVSRLLRIETAQRIKVEDSERRAKTNLQLAHQAVETFLVRVSDDPRIRARGLEQVRKELLELSQQFYDKLGERDQQAGVQRTRAAAYRRLAQITARLGDPNSALGFYEQAQQWLGRSQRSGHDRGAISYEQATCQNEMAMLLNQLDKRSSAKLVLNEAGSTFQTLVSAYPEAPEMLAGLADNRHKAAIIALDERKFVEADRNLKSAVESYRKVIAVSPGYRAELAKCFNNMAISYRNRDRWGDAERCYRESLHIWETLVSVNPDDPEYQLNLAGCHNNLGVLYRLQEKHDQAEKEFAASLSMHESLAKDHAEVLEFRNQLAASYNNLGDLLQDQSRTQEAINAYRKAVSVYQELVDVSGCITEYMMNLATSCNNLGSALVQCSANSEAEKYLRQAAEWFRRVLKQDGDMSAVSSHLAGTLDNLEDLYGTVGDLAKQSGALQESCEVRRLIADRSPTDGKCCAEFVGGLIRLASLRSALRESAEAERVLRDSDRFIDRLANLDVDAASMAWEYAGAVWREIDQPSQGAEWLANAVNRLTSSEYHSCSIPLARLIGARAECLESCGRYREAVHDWRSAQAMPTPPDMPDAGIRLALCLTHLGDYTAAVELANKAKESPSGNCDELEMAARVFVRAARDAANTQRNPEDAGAALVARYRGAAVECLRRSIQLGNSRVPRERKRILQDVDFCEFSESQIYGNLPNDASPQGPGIAPEKRPSEGQTIP